MRTFESKPAKRERVPIWLGLFGPPGSGKTFSALRLATGIARETGSRIYVVDTEARRSLHYADRFNFEHIDMAAPFASADYLDAVRYCVKAGAGVVVVDSASHEHEGPGGYLATHDTELERLSRGDASKRDRVNLLAWNKPSRERQTMVNALAQIPCHFVWCFRGKEKVKPGKDEKTGASVLVDLGWQPISGIELAYQMTVLMRLEPNSGGVPSWGGEDRTRLALKLPEHFRHMFATPRALDEDMGAQFARWAKGDKPDKEPDTSAGEYTDERVETMLAEAACEGAAELARAWAPLPNLVKRKWKARLDSEYKPIASKFDNAKIAEQAEKRKADASAPT